MSAFDPHLATHRYAWRNNAKRAALFGGYCRIVASGSMRSVLIEFACDGGLEVVDRRALRRLKENPNTGGQRK
jgi:hypothetical protein